MAHDDALMPAELSDKELEQVKTRKQKAGLAKAQEGEDVRFLMSTPQGRRLFFRLLDMTGLNQNPFTGDNDKTNYLCGRASAGDDQQKLAMKWCPNEFIKMLQENQLKEDTND